MWKWISYFSETIKIWVLTNKFWNLLPHQIFQRSHRQLQKGYFRMFFRVSVKLQNVFQSICKTSWFSSNRNRLKTSLRGCKAKLHMVRTSSGSRLVRSNITWMLQYLLKLIATVVYDRWYYLLIVTVEYWLWQLIVLVDSNCWYHDCYHDGTCW